MNLFDSKKKLGIDGVVTVSYTHLDVYKRQLKYWSDRVHAGIDT